MLPDPAHRAPTPPASGWLDPLLSPQSLALMGASDRPDTPGNTMVQVAAVDGFAGRVHVVNPRRLQIAGRPCHPDLVSLPERVDHVVIALGDAQLELALAQAIDHGARAATIFATADLSQQGDPHLVQRLGDRAREAGLALCGPNTMGFLNPRRGLRVTGYPSRIPMRPGPTVLITQSGSVFSALAFNHQRLRYALVASTGRELTVGAEHYLDWALDQPDIRAIGLFLETARRPDAFLAALERADRLDVPVVALKVGRTALSARFAASHSGAIVGDAAAYEAVFARHGVTAVETLDQLGATLQLFSATSRAPAGGLAAIHDSGGEREMVVDLATREGVRYAAISEHTRSVLRAHLDSGLQPENPLDAWGSGIEFEHHVEACMAALLADPDTAIGVQFQDIRDGSYIAAGFARAVMRAGAAVGKPVAIVTNYASVSHDGLALEAAEAGVPVLDGTEEGLRAIAAWFARRDRAHRLAAQTPDTGTLPDAARRTHWRQRLAGGAAIGEAEALALLADYGIATPGAVAVADAGDAVAAARRLGFPVVLKTAAPGIAHKSDVGGVRLNLGDAAAVAAAYDQMAARLGPEVVVARMIPPGVELAFGLVHDAQFGPVVMLAAGGLWLELLGDRVVTLPPVTVAEAAAMIARLRIDRVLAGARGQPAADRQALARAFVAFTQLAADLGDLIQDMDVNPVIAGPDGCTAVDALLVPRPPAPSRPWTRSNGPAPPHPDPTP